MILQQYSIYNVFNGHCKVPQYFRNISNSFINIFAVLQDFNEIFSKYSFNITVLCGLHLDLLAWDKEITLALKSATLLVWEQKFTFLFIKLKIQNKIVILKDVVSCSGFKKLIFFKYISKVWYLESIL